MANIFTLDVLKAEVQKQFEPFVIGLSDGSECSLTTPLKLSQDGRKIVKENLEELNKADPDDESQEAVERIIEHISRVFYAVADKPAKLLADLSADDKTMQAMLMSKVLNAWFNEHQVGEA